MGDGNAYYDGLPKGRFRFSFTRCGRYSAADQVGSWQ
jgi:hypothetical protein